MSFGHADIPVGHSKQGAAFGYTKIQDESLLIPRLNALAATVSTVQVTPGIVGTRLGAGNANSARGAASWPPGRSIRRVLLGSDAVAFVQVMESNEPSPRTRQRKIFFCDRCRSLPARGAQ